MPGQLFVTLELASRHFYSSSQAPLQPCTHRLFSCIAIYFQKPPMYILTLNTGFLKLENTAPK